MKQNLTVQILIGLPGVGKSHHAQFMKLSNNRVKVINRDEIRCDTIAFKAAEAALKANRTDPAATLADEDKEFEKFVKEHKEIKGLDGEVDEYERKLFQITMKRLRSRSNPRINFIIFDGCHTKWKSLEELISCIKKYPEVYLEVYIFGDDKSSSEIPLNNKKENDYSDYQRWGFHNSIPEEVFERKRKELKDLLDNHLKELQMLTDYQCMEFIETGIVFPLSEYERGVSF